MSLFVWVMIGVALWHLSVLVPDRFYGGIIGALIAAVAGAIASGYLLPSPGIPPHNPPGGHGGALADPRVGARAPGYLPIRRSP